MKEQKSYSVRVTESLPSNPAQWNALCLHAANLQQSTHIDHSHELFRQKPVFFEIWYDEILVGGVKIFLYKPSRNALLTNIGAQFQQIGEIIIAENQDKDELMEILTGEIDKYVKDNNIVSASQIGYYTDESLLPAWDEKKISRKKDYLINYIDLDQHEEDLRAQLDRKHKYSLGLAERNELDFFESDDFPIFMKLVRESFKTQPEKCPREEYLRSIFTDLYPLDIARIFMVSHNRKVLATALVTFFGNTAYYAFGGTHKNKYGAGQYLQWKIMLECKELGIKYYYFGQVSSGHADDSEKFADGISKFKRNFGGTEAPSFSRSFVFHKPKFMLWNLLLKLSGKS